MRIARVRGWARVEVLSARYGKPVLAVGFLIVIALGIGWWVSLITELAGPITQSGHHDFFAFYSAATLIHTGHPQSLYNATAITALERSIWPHPTGYAGYMPFLNPPSAAVILSPLASLSFGAARVVWLAINIALAIACALVLTSGRDRRLQLLAVAAVLASFPAFQALVEGQWSFVMLLGSLGALVTARRQRDWLAGVLLVVLWLKPPLFLLVLVWLLVTRHWRIAAGAVGAVIVLTLVTLPATGVSANLNYIQYLGGVTAAHATGSGAAGSTTWEGALPNMEGLIGLAATLAGQVHALAVDILTGVMAIGLLAYFIWTTRLSWLVRPLPLQVALAALCLGLLLDPHLYAQDCVLLVVLVAVVLAHMRAAGPRFAAIAGGIWSLRTQALVLLAGALLMDLSAIDTYSIQGAPIAPLHLLTFVLIAGVVALGWPLRPRPASP
jgi:Glycosyltransferase family 87